MMAAVVLVTSAAAHAQFYELGAFNDGESWARAVSSNGIVVGGTWSATGSGAFSWTLAGGMVALAPLAGDWAAEAYAISASGTVIAGMSYGDAGPMAVRWTSGGVFELGTISGNPGTSSEARGVNALGDVIVGVSHGDTGPWTEQAFRWSGGSMQGLGFLNGGDYSHARAVNAAGDVVVGYASDANEGFAERAFRWTSTGGMKSLGTLGGNSSGAYGVNAAGDVVVGVSLDANNKETAFRWTENGMESLGLLNGGSLSRAYAVSDSGGVVVGSAADGASNNQWRAVVWTSAGGIQSVEDWLAAAGVAVGAGAQSTNEAYGVSPDGSTVVGQLQDSRAFVARVAAIGSGMIEVEPFNATLTAAAPMAVGALTMSDLVMHGAHGNPLQDWLAPSRTWGFSATGDLGQDRRGAMDASAALAEMRWSRRVSESLQLQAAIGRTEGRQRLLQEGRAVATGTYVLPELLWRIGAGPVYLGAGYYYNHGDIDVRRGYLNAGSQDFSAGRPGASTHELRLRLDWQDAARVGGAALTPYVSYTHAKTRVDAYTEAGGGFPVRWDERRDTSRIVRAGLDAVMPLEGARNARLLGRVEAATRVGERTAGAATGTVLGLNDFSIAGQEQRRSWLRAGLGGEMAAGAGVLSGMLHATSSGGWPAAAWLSVNYRVAF
ncbi:MAG: autotransporter domain-containing protein [Burkholderiaceae bacterium]|nr:autotransporter domain-containing protein [Burkholderiaceae bacterium]